MSHRSNPFLVEGYINEAYFCDRVEETRTLLQALQSGRNVTLMSPRRMGKSGLIHHAFALARQQDKDVRCFYVDLFHTHSLKDLINVFAAAAFGAFDTPIEKLYNNITSIFKRCRPVITPDMMTGALSLSLNVDSGQESHTLKQIFEYLAASGKRIYVAFDEFQQISEYPEKGVEALLRSYIQLLPDISFIFAGSKKHIMQEMFTSPKRPFYQSTQTLSLQTIDKLPYYGFAAGHFAKRGKSLPQETFGYIYDTVFGHTWYVQYWLSRLFDGATRAPGVEDAMRVLAMILREEDENFYTYTKLMTAAQLKTLKAIARERELHAPITAELIRRQELPAASTVRSCIKTLHEKEFVVEERGVYSVYNRFFMLWLRNQA